MTTEESRESLDRAVEEARNGWHRAEESPDFIVWRYYEDGECHGAVTLPKEVEAAVSAKARAEERERAEDALMEMLQTLSPFSGGQSRPARLEDGRRALAQAEAIMWRMVPDYGRQQEIARRLWSARSSEEAGNAMPDLRD